LNFRSQHKVTSFTVYSGASLGELNLLETVETESNIGSWYSVLIKDESNTHFRIELRGVENNIRIRQIKLLGYSNDAKVNQDLSSSMKKNTNAHHIQQKYCELETLRVFRVLTNQVFGKLIINQERPMSNQNFAPAMVESHMDSPSGDSLDLREHMVGILFSRSKLTHLQTQVKLVSKTEICFFQIFLTVLNYLNRLNVKKSFENNNFTNNLISLTDYRSHRSFDSKRSSKVS
jgi:RCR-type E3 ubiquitin transferase